MRLFKVFILTVAIQSCLSKTPEEEVIELCPDESTSTAQWSHPIFTLWASKAALIQKGFYYDAPVMSPKENSGGVKSAGIVIKYTESDEDFHKLQLNAIKNQVSLLKSFLDDTNSPMIKFQGCYTRVTGQKDFSSLFSKKTPNKMIDAIILMEPLRSGQWVDMKDRDSEPMTNFLVSSKRYARLAMYQSLAKQMNYLHQKGYFHNNVGHHHFILGPDNGSVAKLYGFSGITKPGEKIVFYNEKLLSCDAKKDKKGSVANDAWAFGVALCEIEFGGDVCLENYDLSAVQGWLTRF